MGFVYNLFDILPQNQCILLVVPNLQLVTQMYKDALDYGLNDCDLCKFTGKEKNIKKNAKLIITNTQYLLKSKNDKKIPKKFAILVDECHGIKPDNVIAKWVFKQTSMIKTGFTATLPKDQFELWNLQSLLGPIIYTKSVMEMVDKDIITGLKVKSIYFQHSYIPTFLPREVMVKPAIFEQLKIQDAYINKKGKTIKAIYEQGKLLKHEVWETESEDDFIRNLHRYQLEWIENQENVNQMIAKLPERLKGNTIILYKHTAHGKKLFDLVKSKHKYFIHGHIDIKDRETAREIAELRDDVVIVANYACFSTGINIKNIRNIVLASTTNRFTRLMQSIGRGVRKMKGKGKLLLIDVFHNLKYSEKHHFERTTIYEDEYDISNIKRLTINL